MGKKVKDVLVNDVLEIDTKKVYKLDEIVSIVNYTTLALIIIACIVATATLTMGVITSITVFKSESMNYLANNQMVTSFITRINSYDIENVKEIILNDTKVELFIFEILMPTLLFVAASIYGIVLCKKIMDFVSELKTEKQVFTKEKFYEFIKLKNIIIGFLIIVLIVFDFSLPYFVGAFIMDILLEIISYFYKHCLKGEK